MIETIASTPSLPRPRGGAPSAGEPASEALFAAVLAGLSLKGEAVRLAAVPDGSARAVVPASAAALPAMAPARAHGPEPSATPSAGPALEPRDAGSLATLADWAGRSLWGETAAASPLSVPAAHDATVLPELVLASEAIGPNLRPPQPTSAESAAISKHPPLPGRAVDPGPPAARGIEIGPQSGLTRAGVPGPAAAATGDRPRTTAATLSEGTIASVTRTGGNPYLPNLTSTAQADGPAAGTGARPVLATGDLTPLLSEAAHPEAGADDRTRYAEDSAPLVDGQVREREAVVPGPEGQGAPRPLATALRPPALAPSAPTVALRDLPALALHAFADGRQMLLVSLEPAALGRVQVAFEFGPDGRVSLRLRAEKAEALERLQREASSFARIFGAHGMDLSMAAVSFELFDQKGEDESDLYRGHTRQAASDGKLEAGTSFASVLEHLFDLRT